jgi:hypothetical protein
MTKPPIPRCFEKMCRCPLDRVIQAISIRLSCDLRHFASHDPYRPQGLTRWGLSKVKLGRVFRFPHRSVKRGCAGGRSTVRAHLPWRGRDAARTALPFVPLAGFRGERRIDPTPAAPTPCATDNFVASPVNTLLPSA